MRVREWMDLYSQLRQVAGTLGIRGGSEAGHPDRVHQALLSGLLSHLGLRDDQTVVCGMSLGHADESAKVNQYHTARESAESFTTWVG